MQPILRKSLNLLTTLAVATTLMSALCPSAWAATNDAEQARQQRAAQRQERRQAMLAKMAQELDIQPAQQDAWQAYVDAHAATVARAAHNPEADAATIARNRADAAAAYAQKQSRIADATVKLRAVLTPQQRATLDRSVRHAARRGHHGHQYGANGERAEPGPQ